MLWLVSEAPWPARRGTAVRDLALLRRLAPRHDVTLAVLCRPGEGDGLDGLRALCRDVVAIPVPAVGARAAARHLAERLSPATYSFVTREGLARFGELAQSSEFDLVQIEHSFLAPYVECLPEGARTVLSLHNVGSTQYAAMRAAARGRAARASLTIKQRLVAAHERRWLPRFDLALTVSELDRATVERLHPGTNVAVVENGVDTAVEPLPEGEAGELLFVGELSYPPNAAAVEYFCESILPHVPEARLTVVGAGAPQSVRALASRPSVELVGPVDDLLPFYRRARVCIAPLLAGGGTRLKILEAIALGRPMVSTSVGCEGLGMEHGHELLVADSAEGFANAVAGLLADGRGRAELARAGRTCVEQRYSWDAIAQRHEQALLAA